MTRQKSSYRGRARHLNKRESQEQTRKSETHQLPLLGVPQEHQANSHNTYTEDLVQPHAGSVLAASVSMGTCVPHLVDSAGHALLESTTPLTPTVHPLCLPWGFLISKGRDWMENLNLYSLFAQCLALGVCTHSHLLLKEASLWWWLLNAQA